MASRRTLNLTLSLTLPLATLLAACGGGSGDSDPQPAPQPVTQSATGLWTGKTVETSATPRNLTGVVLSDGTYYILYSARGTTQIAGVVQGSGSVQVAQFSSDNAVDFNFEGLGIHSAKVAAIAKTKASLNGEVSYAQGTQVTYTSSYNADFETTPSLATVAGTYTGKAVLAIGQEAATFTVASSGSFSGQGASTCKFTGTVKPRSDGNVYDTTVSFGAAPCHFANQTLSGIAYYDAATRQLVTAAPNAARTDGVLFVGTKP